MDNHSLYAAHASELEDFWNRRHNAPRWTRRFHVFGREVVLVSNLETPLAAVDYSLPLFSEVPPSNATPFHIQVAARPEPAAPGFSLDAGEIDLAYSGEGDWIWIETGRWGSAVADLASGRAVANISPELAARPDLFSLTILNTLLLNFCLANGYGMLHASCLERDNRALLLMAPHNSGKSTTALRLVLDGYRLFTDSMVHIVPESSPGPPLLAGFPTRRIKLRGDMVDQFPELLPLLETERVREELKYVLDLEQVSPERVMTGALRPAGVTLCLLARGEDSETTWRPAAASDVIEAVMANSLFYGTPEQWDRNLTAIRRLLRIAGAYHVRIGHDPDSLLAAFAELWASSTAQDSR